jgi:hypothetical protein
MEFSWNFHFWKSVDAVADVSRPRIALSFSIIVIIFIFFFFGVGGLRWQQQKVRGQKIMRFEEWMEREYGQSIAL